MSNLVGETTELNVAAVRGTHTGEGTSGVFGEATSGRGVSGLSKGASGVAGESTNNSGLSGLSHNANGVFGESRAAAAAGVVGTNDNSRGVEGHSKSGDAGVFGGNVAGAGVKGVSEEHDGVQGFAKHRDHAGVVGTNDVGTGMLAHAVRVFIGDSPC